MLHFPGGCPSACPRNLSLIHLPEQIRWQKRAKKNTPVPLAEQQFHHHRWHVYVYVELTPKILLDNLRNPWRPFFADGVEVEIFRPDMPPDPHINSDCCPRESCSCKCFNHVEEITVRYFRAQFFALSGCRSLQCGACLGPCSTQCCYTPCFGGDEESGHCKACEPEGVRINRWVHEADERKRERTVQFFMKRPDLMRPSERVMGNALAALPQQADLTLPLLPPGQQQICQL